MLFQGREEIGVFNVQIQKMTRINLLAVPVSRLNAMNLTWRRPQTVDPLAEIKSEYLTDSPHDPSGTADIFMPKME